MKDTESSIFNSIINGLYTFKNVIYCKKIYNKCNNDILYDEKM